jgi:RNA polymerase sigma factor (sigma-70 family)
MHADDMALVQEFAASNSEQAFTALVQRHINLVYSVALRQLGNMQDAEEVTQAVFIILTKKTASLRKGTILSGWLYQTAQLTSANFQRAARRRQRREQEAYMQFIQESEPDVSCQRLSPLLEEAMAKLGQAERDAVVLRFFENRTVREVAVALGLQEAAAQKRVNRATDKLRQFFLKRGVQVSTGALLVSLGANAVQAAPAGLASTVVATAALKGAAVSTSTLTLIKTTLNIMAWMKAKTAIMVGVGILIAAGTTTVVTSQFSQKPAKSAEAVASQFIQNPAGALTMEAMEFVGILAEQHRLPGFGSDEHGNFQMPVPGLFMDDRGVWHGSGTNVESYPVARTISVGKNFGPFVYHYTVVKESATNNWQLRKAWRTNAGGHVVEQYPVQ